MNLGLLGDWQTGNSGGTVRQLADGGATFFVSPANVIDQPFAGRILVDAATTDDDFVGLVFGLSTDATTGRPDSYYLLSWKGTAQGGAEAGVKLVKVTGTGASGETPDFWNLDASDPRLQVIDEDALVPWSAGIAYDFDVDYRSDGTIGVDLMRGDTGELLWSYSGIDPAPLGAGRAGFYNLSQADVTYSASALGPVALTDGVYQLRATAGSPGLRGLDGTALDGDANGTPGGDFVRSFTIDTVAPVVTGTIVANNALFVSISDIGGMNAAATGDISRYTLFASGGDGTDRKSVV